MGGIGDDTLHLFALARGEAEADTTAVRTAWQMFVSPTAWSWRPLKSVWRRDAPPLRHALRAALAVGTAYAIALALPFLISPQAQRSRQAAALRSTWSSAWPIR